MATLVGHQGKPSRKFEDMPFATSSVVDIEAMLTAISIKGISFSLWKQCQVKG